jgi:hypothetical protein
MCDQPNDRIKSSLESVAHNLCVGAFISCSWFELLGVVDGL